MIQKVNSYRPGNNITKVCRMHAVLKTVPSIMIKQVASIYTLQEKAAAAEGDHGTGSAADVSETLDMEFGDAAVESGGDEFMGSGYEEGEEEEPEEDEPVEMVVGHEQQMDEYDNLEKEAELESNQQNKKQRAKQSPDEIVDLGSDDEKAASAKPSAKGTHKDGPAFGGVGIQPTDPSPF